MERREIFFVNLTVSYKKKTVYLEKVVYKERYDKKYHNLSQLKKHGIKEAVDIVNIDVIRSLGLETEQASKNRN